MNEKSIILTSLKLLYVGLFILSFTAFAVITVSHDRQKRKDECARLTWAKLVRHHSCAR